MKSKDSLEICAVNFWYQQLLIQWNTNSCWEHITGAFNIYLYSSVSALALAGVACLCLCVWYQIRVLAKYLIMCQTSVNLLPCCISYARFFWANCTLILLQDDSLDSKGYYPSSIIFIYHYSSISFSQSMYQYFRCIWKVISFENFSSFPFYEDLIFWSPSHFLSFLHLPMQTI